MTGITSGVDQSTLARSEGDAVPKRLEEVDGPDELSFPGPGDLRRRWLVESFQFNERIPQKQEGHVIIDSCVPGRIETVAKVLDLDHLTDE